MAPADRRPGTTVLTLRERTAWKALERHHPGIAARRLCELFAEDPDRGVRLTAEAVGIHLDYSKNRVDDETIRLLLELAEESGLRERRDMMFRGERTNVSENRSVLHVALRMPRGPHVDRESRTVRFGPRSPSTSSGSPTTSPRSSA